MIFTEAAMELSHMKTQCTSSHVQQSLQLLIPEYGSGSRRKILQGVIAEEKGDLKAGQCHLKRRC